MRLRKTEESTRRLITEWGSRIEALADKDQVLREYPRPTMVRPCWQCLNGMWRYALVKGAERPAAYEGDILVPFSPETRLSGVERQLLPGMSLWYEREIRFSEEIKGRIKAGDRVLLHFGAVDWHCEVTVNGVRAGEHDGGYLPFTFDITGMLKKEAPSFGEEAPQGCTIRIRVEDVSDTAWHSVGKQTLKPGGMYYPAVSGIWQTVWLECVPAVYLEDVTFCPDYDRARVAVKCRLAGVKKKAGAWVGRYLRISFPGGEYGAQILEAGAGTELMIPDFIAWTPEDPYLYRVRVELWERRAGAAGMDRAGAEECLDAVESYFAVRKCCIGTDASGIRRIFLNDRPCMQVGILDQGYWPESLYTAPDDEALLYDIKTMKELGFNMLRKHVKVEPERFYYHCDRLGMLVWQDAVNGGRKNKSFYVTYMATLFNALGVRPGDGHPILLSRQDKEGRAEYRRELAQMTRLMRKHASVVCIVPFNEGWGQFSTEKMTALVRRLNPGVIVDQASGWFDMGGGDVKSIHHYFLKLKYRREGARALALTEFGGYVRRVEGHTLKDKVYGYRIFAGRAALEKGYARLMREEVLPAVTGGVSATVYTQLSDVEEEINGLLTYDRAKLKLSAETIKKWNLALAEAGEGRLLTNKPCADIV